MEQLRHVVLVLLTIGAFITLTGLVAGLYEFRTGRILRILFRRKVPATPEDVRKNGLALVLNDLGVLLTDLIILSVVLVYDVPFDPFVEIASVALGLAGFSASFIAAFTALNIKSEVHFVQRRRGGSVPTAQS
jgi:hypothetical protein